MSAVPCLTRRTMNRMKGWFYTTAFRVSLPCDIPREERQSQSQGQREKLITMRAWREEEREKQRQTDSEKETHKEGRK